MNLTMFRLCCNHLQMPKFKVLTVVSPMKKSHSSIYFDSEICDGRASMRLIGFDSGVRRKLADFKDDSIVLSN